MNWPPDWCGWWWWWVTHGSEDNIGLNRHRINTVRVTFTLIPMNSIGHRVDHQWLLMCSIVLFAIASILCESFVFPFFFIFCLFVWCVMLPGDLSLELALTECANRRHLAAIGRALAVLPNLWMPYLEYHLSYIFFLLSFWWFIHFKVSPNYHGSHIVHYEWLQHWTNGSLLVYVARRYIYMFHLGASGRSR